MRPHLLLLALLPVAGLAACADSDPAAHIVGPSTTAPAAVELTRSGGCGEAFLWAASDDGRVVVTVGVEVERFSAREPVTIEVDLADPEFDAALLRGHADLTRNLCVDVLEEDAEPDETVPLTAGTGELVIGPVSTDVSRCGDVTGTLDLADVEAEDGTRIGTVHAETEDIGCFAG